MKHQLLLFKFTLLIVFWAAMPFGMWANNALFSHNVVVGRNVLCYTKSVDWQRMTVSIIIEQDQNLTGEVTINERAYFKNDNLNLGGTFTITEIKRIRGNGITKINLPACVTTIEKQAFLNCKGLCVVRAPKGTVSAKFAFMVDLNEDNNPTGIDELETGGVESGHHTFYTLDGKAMGNNFDALPKGTIYIVNGKKIYKF